MHTSEVDKIGECCKIKIYILEEDDKENEEYKEYTRKTKSTKMTRILVLLHSYSFARSVYFSFREPICI